MMVEFILALSLFVVVVSYYFTIKRSEIRQISKFTNLKDIESENVLYDAPTANDRIGFSDYAKVLAEYIKNSNSFAVYGIYGPWGSGKTSLMKMVREELNEQRNIWFDAWKFKGKVSIFDALCQVLGEKLQQDLHNGELRKKSNNLLKTQDNVKLKIKYNVKNLNEFNDNMTVLVNYLNDRRETKLVIFVDDLDRCNPSEAVDFLENLKVFFDIPRINFVIGVNYDILYYEINKRYKEVSSKNINFTEEYLAKIVNIPFFIPTLDKQQINSFIERNVKDDSVLCAANVLATGLEGNLRTIKRVINSFMILKNIAMVRNIEISPKLLAKILVIQYRYKEIYNNILLQPGYLLTLQDMVVHENMRYSKRVVGRNRELERLPVELKEILKIEPYFEQQDLNIYINLSQEKQNEVRQNKDSQIQEYLIKIQNGNLEEIPDLRIFKPMIRKQIIEIICNDFEKYEKEKQLQAVDLLAKLNIEEVKKFFDELLESDKIDCNIEEKILLSYSAHGINIESYIWRVLSDFSVCDEIQKRNRLILVISLLKDGNRVCLDVAERMFDKVNWIDADFIFKETVVEALGESKDKKAIDLLVKFLNERDIDIIHTTFNAIAKLDVNALLEWYDVYVGDKQYRGAFLGTIAQYANKGDSIIDVISIEEIVQLLTREVDENSQIAEIKLLNLISLNRIDNSEYYMDDSYSEQIKISVDCLSFIARHDTKWKVRDEAERTKEAIIKAKEERECLF